MKIKSVCPNCGRVQNRWEFLEPLPGFINQCVGCGAYFKTSKKAIFIGAFIGLIVVASIILAEEHFITWGVGISTILILLLGTFYISSYITPLIHFKCHKQQIVLKRMGPFFKWQLLIILFLFGSFFDNGIMQASIKTSKKLYSEIETRIENLNSVEKMKKIQPQKTN